jgi:hypothetical protein
VGWYARAIPQGDTLRTMINQLDDANAQLRAVRGFLDARAQLPGTPWPAEKRAA